MMTQRGIMAQEARMQALLKEAEAAQLTREACVMRPAAIGWSCRRLRLGRLRGAGTFHYPGCGASPARSTLLD